MPYTVSSNAEGCSGFAVVKEGENSPILGGCHKTKADAIAHMVALQAEYEDGESRQELEMEDEGNDSEENLLPRQTAMYELYESIAENFGQWNQGSGADGAHYAEVSPFQDEGLICANCVFYEGGQRCEIVEGQIKPLAICKLWIIEESLLPVAGIKFVDGEPEEEPAEYNTRASVNLVAPAFMKASARRGLALHEEGYSGDGLRPQTVEDARKMANGEALSPEKWRKISPWIARHTVDLDAVQGDEITAGLVAMLLWGGGSSKASASRAKSYAERIVAQLEESREQPRDKLGRFGSSNSTGDMSEYGDEYDIPEETISTEAISSKEVNRIARKISEKEDALINQEGLDSMDIESLEEGLIARDTLRLMRQDYQPAEGDPGWDMTDAAVESWSKSTVTTTLTNQDGHIAGAVNFTRDPNRALGVPEPVIEMRFLGTTGIVDGAGSTLFGSVIRYAAKNGGGLALQPLDSEALMYWQNMGFQDAGSGLYMSSNTVKAIAGKIGK
jgi:hypothetical protein